jgi:hypothetical protein
MLLRCPEVDRQTIWSLELGILPMILLDTIWMITRSPYRYASWKVINFSADISDNGSMPHIIILKSLITSMITDIFCDHSS